MNKLVIVGVMSVGLVLMGCEGAGPKQTGGALIGGAGGALIGSTIGSGKGRIIATGIGAVLGTLIGSEIGTQMDQRDRLLAQRNAEYALETSPDGVARTWNNPNTGRSGRSIVTQTSAYGSQPCRTMTSVTYSEDGYEFGRETKRYCRGPNGWYPVN